MIKTGITEAAYVAVVETFAKGVAILALAALAAAGPALATEPDPPLVAKARRAIEKTKDAAPEFSCYDQTNSETCVRTTRRRRWRSLRYPNIRHRSRRLML